MASLMENAREQMTAWLRKAYSVVNAAYPAVNWERDTEETQKAQGDLDFYLHAYFYSDVAGAPTGTLEGVREAWRKYYKAHLIDTQPEMFTET